MVIICDTIGAITVPGGASDHINDGISTATTETF